MRLKNALIAMVVLLASGATVSFAQESHIGNLQGRASAGKGLYRRYCVGCHGAEGDGSGENAAWVDPSRETSQPLRLSAVRRPLALYQPTRISTTQSLVGS